MLFESLWNALTFSNLLIAAIAAVLGIFFGALPGIGPAVALALFLPFTFSMGPETALIFLGTMYGATIYGGSISAILINSPGTPGSAATSLDGYPMAEQGKGQTALGIAAVASCVGGVISIIVLAFFAPLVARVTILFSPTEYFMLALLGLSVISASSKGSTLKGLVMACFGLMLTFFGYDLITGFIRFDFGITHLEDGLDYIAIIVGIFGLAQVLQLAEEGGTISRTGKVVGKIWDGVLIPFIYLKTLVKSIALGIILGVLPGVGISTANFLAYNEAKRSSKNPESFGKGNPEGVVASESANNAVEGGALIPTLALGIPGSATCAIFLGALMIQGLQPGINLFQNSGDIVYTAFSGMIIGLVLTMILGILGSVVFAKITLVRTEILVPLITLFCLGGAFAIRNNFGEVVITVIFGFIGYILRKQGYPLVPFVLALVLGPLMERNFNTSLILTDGSFLPFITRPISLTLFILALLSIIQPIISDWWKKRKLSQSNNDVIG